MGGKALVENCLALDLAWLMRLGPIRPGQTGSGEVKWSKESQTVGLLHFRLDLRENETAQLTLRYILTAAREYQKHMQQVIALTSLPQNFGGRRWWMRCPMTGEQVRILYLPPGEELFASRKAHGLAYGVERLSRFDRPFEKLFRVQRKLGGAHGLGVGLEKPKGMWQSTFARHFGDIAKYDAECAEHIGALVQKTKRGPVHQKS